MPDRTDWHNIVMWRDLAKIAERYVHKGDKIYVEGRIRYRYYDDKKGQRRFIAEIYADNMELLTPKQASTTVQNNQAQDNTRTKIKADVDNDTLPF